MQSDQINEAMRETARGREVIDYYKTLNLPRTCNESQLLAKLKLLYRLWQERSGTIVSADEEQMCLIQESMASITHAIVTLTDAANRRAFDRQLDAARSADGMDAQPEAEPQSAYERADRCYREGQPELAQRYAKEAVEGGADHAGAHALLARCHYDMGEYQEALDVLDHALCIYQHVPGLDNLRIRYLMRLGEYGKAHEALDKSLATEGADRNFLLAEAQYLAYCTARDAHTKEAQLQVMRRLATTMEEGRRAEDLQTMARYMAHNLYAEADRLYLFAEDGKRLFTEKAHCEASLRLLSTAYRLNPEPYIEALWANARVLGESVYDERNRPAIYFQIGLSVAIVLFALSSLRYGLQSFCLLLGGLVLLNAYMTHKHNYVARWVLQRAAYTNMREPRTTATMGLLRVPRFIYRVLRKIFRENLPA